MKHRNSIRFLIVVLCLCCAILTGCYPAVTEQYSITVDQNIENGIIECDRESAFDGEVITVDATANENYRLVSITVNGNAIEGDSFVMPKENVVIGAIFELAPDLVEAIPEGAIKIKAQSAGGASATGHITLVFGEQGLTFEAFVEDSSLVERDGVAILFSRELPVIAGLLPNGNTIKVAISAKGDISVLATDADGVLQAAELAGVSAKCETWSKNGEKLDGYHAEAFIPYAVLGVSAETAKGNVTVCPVVYSAYGSLPATSASLQGVTEDAQNSFAVLTDDNKVRDNKYNMLSAQLGSYGTLDQGKYWDLSKDYYADDAANYANREALLTGHDNNDNNILFYRVSANEMYVRATLTVTGVSNKNDQWPKFGLMLFDGATKKGVFFYVDSYMSAASGNTADNIIGRDLGYNIASGDYGAWVTAKNGAFDLTSKSITLEMVYQNGWLHMYAEGQLVKTIYYGSYNENLHFGIKSFGIDLKVTDYLASADAEADGWADKKIDPPAAKSVDILFAGDSYMEIFKGTRGVMDNNLSYTGATYANVGVGGTRVQYWMDKAVELSTLYVPSKIAFHISVNDIDDAGADPAEVLTNLKAMLAKYHELFPDATIYWNSLIPNTMFANKYEDYKVVNAGVLEYAAENDWLVYVDQTTSFDNNGAARPDVFYDGLHLSDDIGYPIWAKNMLTAMGYERIDGTAMGDIDRFAHTGLWEFASDESGEYAYSAGNNDTALWFKGVEGENVYVEAVISATKLNNFDGYPKFGLLVRNDRESRWGFIDAVGFNQNNTAAGMVYRGPVDGSQGNWDWGSALWGGATGCNFANTKLAIAKVGNQLYFLVNDEIYITTTFEGNVVVGFESFNLEVTISDVVTSTDVEFIQKQLREKRNITVVGENEGVKVEVVKKAHAEDEIVAKINVVEGQTLEYVKVDGKDYEVVNGQITFTMPDKDVTIEVALKGLGVTKEIAEANGEKNINASINCETITASVGQTITFTVEHDAKEMSVASVTVNGEQLSAANGVYTYVVKATDTAVAIKATMSYILTEEVDGKKGEGYGAPVSFKVEDGRSVSVWAKTDEFGVYLYAEAITNSVVTNATEWWANHNFEFYLNNGAQSYVNAKGESYGASRAAYNYAKQENGKYLNTAEVYVNRSIVAGFNSESVTLNYAFKAPGELARYEYMINNQFERTDWWRTNHGTPSRPNLEHVGIGTVGVPECIHITKNGIVHDCERASIDGNLSEYAGKNALLGLGNENAKFDFVGYVAEDGVYLGITIYQNALSASTPEWWLNDNLEIKLLGDRAGFSLIDDFIAGCGPVSDYALVRTTGENGYAYKTVVELFYEHDFSTAKQATFQVGVNGNGFAGWQSLMWDGNVPYVNENGIEWITTRGGDWYGAQLDVADKFAAGEGLTIDGKADEALYAGLASVTYDNVNGAKMVVTGRKLSTGIIVLNTITHNRPITDVIQGAGDAWWNFLNLEYRMGGNYGTQLATSTFNAYEAYCSGATLTVDNGDGTYTTTFEMFLPFTTEYGGMNYHGDVQVCIGAVVESGFIWVTGVETSNLYATENGFIRK